MSSPIYFVEVIDLSSERMSCIVSCTSAILGERDRYDFSPSPSLAVAFLWEPWDNMRRGMVASFFDHSMLCSLWCPFGRDEAGDRAARAYIGQVMPHEWSQTMFLDFAPHVIASVEIRDERRCGRVRRISEPLPECTYVITPTDTRLLEHMALGMRWDTTAYEMEHSCATTAVAADNPAALRVGAHSPCDSKAYTPEPHYVQLVHPHEVDINGLVERFVGRWPSQQVRIRRRQSGDGVRVLAEPLDGSLSISREGDDRTWVRVDYDQSCAVVADAIVAELLSMEFTICGRM
jgi:hypothetical protein